MANPWQIEEAQPYRPGSLTAAALASPLYCAMKRMFTRPGQPCGLDDSYELASVFAGTLLSDGHMKLDGNRFYFVLMVTCRGYLEQIKTIPWFAACQIREIREYLKPDGILQTGMLVISSGFPRAQAADLYALFYVDGVKRHRNFCRESSFHHFAFADIIVAAALRSFRIGVFFFGR